MIVCTLSERVVTKRKSSLPLLLVIRSVSINGVGRVSVYILFWRLLTKWGSKPETVRVSTFDNPGRRPAFRVFHTIAGLDLLHVRHHQSSQDARRKSQRSGGSQTFLRVSWGPRHVCHEINVRGDRIRRSYRGVMCPRWQGLPHKPTEDALSEFELRRIRRSFHRTTRLRPAAPPRVSLATEWSSAPSDVNCCKHDYFLNRLRHKRFTVMFGSVGGCAHSVTWAIQETLT